MDVDEDKIDQAVIALLYLASWREKGMPEGVARVWKSFDWDVMERLHEAELISDPVGKAKSVYLSKAGIEKGRELAEALFGKS